MDNRLARAIKKNKAKFIVILILWLTIVLVFVTPISIAITDGGMSKTDAFSAFITSISNNIVKPVVNLSTAFSENYVSTYLNAIGIFTLIYALITIFGFIRSMPKHEYDDIEHGSSDWCENGEQYKILSPKKGIILAEKHYLPVDKRGNTNVLVVGRFRFW